MGSATVMLRDVASGLLLAVDADGEQLLRSTRGDDRAMWRVESRVSESGCFASATLPGVAVRGTQVEAIETHDERRWRINGAVFDEVFAPSRLPSEHLEELRATGITILPGFSRAMTDLLREAVHATNFVDVVDLDDPAASNIQLYIDGRFFHVLRDGKVEGGLAPPPLRVSAARLAPVAHDGACVELTMVRGEKRHFGLSDAGLAETLVERLQGSSDAPSGRRAMRNYLHEDRGCLFGRVHTHPVVLWLLESYFGAPVRASHTPGAKIIMPQDGSIGPGQGWHSDTPYDKGLRGLPHGKTWQLNDSGQIRNVQDGVEGFEAWPDPSRPLAESTTSLPLFFGSLNDTFSDWTGLQCNVCLDPFTELNGGTAYIPMSWTNRGPPPKYDYNADDKFPAYPPETRHMEAPAGSICIYHAATWHRQHMNLSDAPRIGLLQAMVPDTVAEGSSEQARMGIADWLNDGLDSKRASLERWLQSGEPQKLTPREQADLEQLFIGGGGSARL